MRLTLTLFSLLILFTGCIHKQPVFEKSATILIKTPTMKFYDKGFVTHYKDHTHLQIYNAGQSVLELKIYKDKICKDTFACQSLKSFNKDFLDASYEEDFLPKLFEQKQIDFNDTQHKIKIRVAYDY